MGTDILGSVRSVTSDGGFVQERYEYDIFGTPYQGEFNEGMNLGYTGKPYDTATGMYNYGYRDYKPEVARFTTVDPIRDGNNWFAYVNNDPVNYLDPLGLLPFANGQDGMVITGSTPETNTDYSVKINSFLDGKVDVNVLVGPDKNDVMPAVNITTTITYTNDSGESQTKTSTLSDGTDGQGSYGAKEGTTDGYTVWDNTPYYSPNGQIGVAAGISLDTGVETKDITNISVDVNVISTNETINATFNTSPPKPQGSSGGGKNH
jgi:RHS repeat-associated protein